MILDVCEPYLLTRRPLGPPDFRNKLWLPAGLRQLIPPADLARIIRAPDIQATLPMWVAVQPPPVHPVKSPTVHQLLCIYKDVALSNSRADLDRIMAAPCCACDH
jgi:hypothetical protein